MAPWYWAISLLLFAALCAAAWQFGKHSGLPLGKRLAHTYRATCHAVKTFFTAKLTSQQERYILSATVALSVLAFAIQYLTDAGVHIVYLEAIPAGIKYAIAQIVEVGALLAVVYFLVRFVWSLLTKKKTPSAEVQAIDRMRLELSQAIREMNAAQQQTLGRLEQKIDSLSGNTGEVQRKP